MKKKQIIVVKKIEKLSPKKEVYVSRKLQNGDIIDNQDLKESYLGNPAPQCPTRDSNENIITRSILGDAKTFESFVDLEDDTPSPIPQTKRHNSKNNDSTLNSNFVSNKKKSVLIQPNLKLDPQTQPGLYLESLKKLKLKASKLREKELEKETKLIQYLPVNERFDMNKEGKVLAMWQERQKKWDHIQKSLAKRVGGSTESLMMNTGDEFRAKNEEYDVLQAAIPVHERFGAESWKMMLRDGTERSVSVGHVFSGLSCPVGIKAPIPATIRKPRKIDPNSTTLTNKKSNTFVDPTPSLLKKQKQLQKTLQTLRPHSIGPQEVEGFIIPCKNLFDWAIQSSEKFLQEKLNQKTNKLLQNDNINDNNNNNNNTNNTNNINNNNNNNNNKSSDKKDTNINESKSYLGPQITFLSPRNILFHGLQGESVHQVVTFKNTGSSAVTYIWKSIPEKELHEPSDVTSIMLKRKEHPREHILSKERSPFFCSHPTGQILPGDSIETVFSFCSKGSGGNFLETWVLDTLPRAIIYYPTIHSKIEESQSNNNNNGNSNSNGNNDNTPSVPSTVYIKLKGHAFTLDESQYRRNYIAKTIKHQCNLGNVIDETYTIIKRIRKPVTINDLILRKLDLFKSINQEFLKSISLLFNDINQIKLNQIRYEQFINFYDNIIQFSFEISQIYSNILQQLKESESKKLPGLTQTSLSTLKTLKLPDLSLKSHIRETLFPEKVIDIFDEVTEDIINSKWDYDLLQLKEFLKNLIDTANDIQSFEEKLTKNLRIIEKARIYAERKAQDSDYEDEDDDEEEEDNNQLNNEDGEEYIKPKSALVQKTESFLSKFNQLTHMLLIDPLPDFSLNLWNGLSESIEEINQFKNSSLEIAGLKGDLIISTIPSPFTTSEGLETWQSVLSLRQPVTGKKPPAPKPQKGYASDEQRKKYYLSMYELLSNALIEGITQGLSIFDTQMNQKYELCLTNKKISTLYNIATIRQEDINSSSSSSTTTTTTTTTTSSNIPLFILFNGNIFVSQPQKSAFDITNSLRLDAISPIFRAIEFGANTFVLLYESSSFLDSSSMNEVVKEIINLLNQQWIKITSRIRNQKTNLIFNGKYIPSIADLTYYFNNLSKISGNNNSNNNNNNNNNNRNITILLLENLLSPSIVPKTPTYIEELSDDEEDSIPIGLEEYKLAKLKTWESLEPRNLPVNINSLNGNIVVNCLTDGASALNKLITDVNGIWINGYYETYYPTLSGVFSKCIFNNMLVSDEIRELMIWIGIILQFPNLQYLRSTKKQLLSENPTFHNYISNIFPNHIIPQPNLVITIGGNITPEKFRFLESIIEVANSIILVGEFCIPFLQATGVIFQKSEFTSKYHIVCSHLLSKISLRGIQLILPVDLVVGDEVISSDHKMKSYNVIDRDSRDEGGDYDGESKIVSCIESQNIPIRGIPYDIGPTTCNLIQNLIPQHHLHLSWGTVGCCEISSFQSGQRALVESSKNTNTNTTTTTTPTTITTTAAEKELIIPSIRNIVLGETNVEWWSRISDPEGEFDGNIVKKGVADYICRNSKTFISILSQFESLHVVNTLQRLPNANEWDYLTSKRKEDEEEEEEDEEEDNDDDS